MGSDNDINFSDNISDKEEYDPSVVVEKQEYDTALKNNLDNVLSSGIVSDKQKNQIKQYYYEDKTLSEIGKDFGVTREAVRQNIQKGLSKIREYVY